MMKHVLTSAVILTLILGGAAWGQNFTYTAPVTSLPGSIGNVVSFYSEINNLEPTAVEFLAILAVDVPSGWFVTWCVGEFCYPPFIDSVTTVIAGNGMDSILVDFTPDASGDEGWATVTVQPVDHPELAQSLTFHVYFPGGVEGDPQKPQAFSLLEAFPNPFNGAVNFTISLAAPATVDLGVYDLNGRKLGEALNAPLTAGDHRVVWRPENLSSGIYLAKLQTEGATQIRKLIYLR
jgi:hypothetical protein